MATRRWLEPSTVVARVEYRELRKELKRAGSKKRRDELIAKLDALYARGSAAATTEPSQKKSGSLSASSPAGERISKSGTPVSSQYKPSAGSPSERNILSAEEIRAKVEAWTHQLVPCARENALRKAKSAPDSERAAVLLTEFPDHTLNKLAEEMAAWLWQEDRSRPKPDAKQIAQWTVKSWLERRPWNSHDLRGNVETVANAVADVFRLLAEKDAAEPGWFVRRAKEAFDATQLAEPKPKPIVSPAPASRPAPHTREPEPVHSPVVHPIMSPAERAQLVIQTDSWLSNLSTHSPDMHSRIVAALSDELMRCGVAGSDFCTRLYENLRPRAFSKYPPRSF